MVQASPSVHLQTGIPTFLLLLLISCLTLTHSQIIPSDQSAPAPPTMASCGPNILPLTPCASFVQGPSAEPSMKCCQNLVEAYHKQPACVCLLLNGTALASLPINSTRALQLPQLCDVNINSSTCPSSGGSGSPRTPASQVSFTRKPKPIKVPVSGDPTITAAPGPSTRGHSSAYKLAGGQFAAAGISLLLATLLW